MSVHVPVIVNPVFLQFGSPPELVHTGSVLSTFVYTVQSVVFPALSLIVIISVVPSPNVLLYELCVHPDRLSLQSTVTVLFLLIHGVAALVEAFPHTGGVVSTLIFTVSVSQLPTLSQTLNVSVCFLFISLLEYVCVGFSPDNASLLPFLLNVSVFIPEYILFSVSSVTPARHCNLGFDPQV